MCINREWTWSLIINIFSMIYSLSTLTQYIFQFIRSIDQIYWVSNMINSRQMASETSGLTNCGGISFRHPTGMTPPQSIPLTSLWMNLLSSSTGTGRWLVVFTMVFTCMRERCMTPSHTHVQRFSIWCLTSGVHWRWKIVWTVRGCWIIWRLVELVYYVMKMNNCFRWASDLACRVFTN